MSSDDTRLNCYRVAMILAATVPSCAAGCESLLEPDTNQMSAAKLFAQGEALYDQEKFQEASVAYSRAISLDPSLAEAHHKRGFIRVMWNHPEEGLQDLKTALELGMDDAELHNAIAVAHMKLGQNPEALEGFARAIRRRPEWDAPYGNRAIVWLRGGEPQRAFDDCSQALELNVRNPFLHRTLGDALVGLEKYDEAIAAYSDAIRLSPQTAVFYNARAIANGLLGDDARAIEDYGRAIAIQPTEALYYLNRGARYVNSAKFRKGIDDFAKGIELAPHDPAGYQLRSNAYRLLGDGERAMVDYMKAQELKANGPSPTDPHAAP